MKILKTRSFILVFSIIIVFVLDFVDTKIKLKQAKLDLARAQAALAETKASIFEISGLIWRDFAPVNQWSEEIIIGGHPLHLWTGNHHRHYQMMINGVINPRVFEEGETPDFPDDIQTLRLMTVDGNKPIFFEIPGY